jgi:peptidoglycan hydrolase CwlO-like protein
MDSNQLNELATNALLDHWPPHLGVRTEAEKVAYLAEALRQSEEQQVSNNEIRAEMQNEIDRLRDKLQDLESSLDDVRDDLEKLEDKMDTTE